MCARAGVGSRWVVLRWGARVVGGLRRRGEGAVVWCLLTPSSGAAARRRVLGRLKKVFERFNHGIPKQGAPEPSPNLFPTCFTCSGEIDRAVLALQACDGALFLVSLDTFLS